MAKLSGVLNAIPFKEAVGDIFGNSHAGEKWQVNPGGKSGNPYIRVRC